MSEITLDTIERGMKATCGTVLRNEIYFCELDALAGDGDFGNSLAAGFRVIEQDLSTLDKSTINGWLLKISMIISKHTGGSSGPLWGTAFLRAGAAAGGAEDLSGAQVVAMLRAAAEGIKARGQSDVGDKTLLDALVPLTDRLEQELAAGAGAAEALRAAAGTAREAAEATEAMVAKRGRASYTGERSRGSVDAGAVAVALIAERINQTWQKQGGTP